MLPSEEVCDSKTVNIKQYLNTNNFSVNNRHFQVTHHFTPETENIEFYDITKKI
jgi:hypothetical protein